MANRMSQLRKRMHRLRYGVEAYDEEFPELVANQATSVRSTDKKLDVPPGGSTQCTHAGEVSPPKTCRVSSCSWTWRKILKLRSLARDKRKCVVGNGNSTSLWYDNWHPLGPFVSKFGNSFILASGLA